MNPPRTSAVRPVPTEELDLLVRGEHGHPHAVLGPHPHDGAVTVRVLKPLASSVVVAYGEERVDLHLINEGRHENLWQVLGTRVHRYTEPLGEVVTGTSFAVWAPSARGVRVK